MVKKDIFFIIGVVIFVFFVFVFAFQFAKAHNDFCKERGFDGMVMRLDGNFCVGEDGKHRVANGFRCDLFWSKCFIEKEGAPIED